MTILEAIAAGKELQTRDGRKVRAICSDRKMGNPIVALVGEGEMIFTYAENGIYNEDGSKSELDLFIKPVKKTFWVNIYKSPSNDSIYSTGVNTFTTKEEAEAIGQKSMTYFCTKSIEIEICE